MIVIDDVHLVDSDDLIAASLARLLQHLPPWMHFILLSRRDPALPIDRMRSRGHLGEIRFAELRFSPDEAVELLHRLAPALSEEQIEAAVVRSDGWAASLHLAALAARSAHAQADGASPERLDQLFMQDYVLRELLANEAPELIEVLHAAAVVPRLSSSLARAITERSDAGELLLRAEKRGLFVSRLDAGGWFELHALVRDVLANDMEQHSPHRLAELHARAARWFEDTEEVAVALEQWILAGRPRDALRLLSAQHANLYDSGREAIVLRTIGAIPTRIVTGDLEAMVAFAWCHVLVNRRRFLELADEMTWWAERSPANDAMRARVTMLRSFASTISGDWVEGGELARRALRELDDWWQDPLGRFVWNMIARDVALSERWDDTADEVRDAHLALSRDPERRVAFEGTRAVGHALAGRPLDALRVIAGVRRAAPVSEMTILRAELALAEAVAHRELGDRARALQELRALAEEPGEPMLYCRIYALLELTQASLDMGYHEVAAQTFADAEALVERESFGADGRTWLARVGTMVGLAAGELGDAARWAAQVDDPFWAGVMSARLLLARNDRSGAAEALAAADPRCVRHGVVLGLLTARVARRPRGGDQVDCCGHRARRGPRDAADGGV